VARFCYVGSQVAIAGYFINYVTAVKPSLTSAQGANLLVVAQAFFAALFMKVVKPRYILLTYMSGIIVFITTAIGTKGNTGIAMLSLVLFFESCICPTIFTSSLRGLGRHTKRSASFPVSSESGGCIPTHAGRCD
jgi:FHS family L-fucose permease-like MFS transporter